MRGAVVDGVCGAAGAVFGAVAGAVVPEGDVVDVFDVEGLLDGRRGGVDYLVGDGVGGQVDEGGVDVDVCGVGAEEVEVVVGAVVLVCAA